ncbi:MAG: GNAT family N-acetyltransferase [Chloroflexi bacterium]|nr:GNAT family N-acetyltransferase [Chloroflexota bacterium]
MESPAATDPRLLTPADADRAAWVIAQAFLEDPLVAFMLPNARSRPRTLLKFFRAYGTAGIRSGRVYGVGDPLQGVAYWNPPGGEGLSISVKSLGAFLPILFTAYPLGIARARPALDLQDALHKKHAPAPHYYLDNIGVLAEARGKGLASLLIRPFLQQADAQHVAAYTDTYTDANVPLYEHFGFEVVEEAAVPALGLTLWALRRAPR